MEVSKATGGSMIKDSSAVKEAVDRQKKPYDDNTEDTGNKDLGSNGIGKPHLPLNQGDIIKKRVEKQPSNTDKNDKLEEYLEILYDRECKFSCSDEDVQFIQSGIEKFVDEIVDICFSKLRCRSEFCNIRHSRPELLKVGSFYERTKNKFPNEFDFNVVIGTVEDLPKTDLFDHQRGTIDDTKLAPIKSETYSLSFLNCLGQNGPADTYSFCFRKGDVEETITVDISPALRYIYTPEIHKRRNIIQNDEVFHPDFHQAILNTNSFLLLDFKERTDNCLPWKVCVTETEINFVKNNVSEKHMKVYRLLKYLINGHFSSDLFRGISPFFSMCISSYNIKVAVLYHHFKCKNNSSGLSNCVLDLLNYFCNKEIHRQSSRYPMRSVFPRIMPDTLVDFQVKRYVNTRYETFESCGHDNRFAGYPGFRVLYSTRTNTSELVCAFKSDIKCFRNIFRTFIERLKLLKSSTRFEKCVHTVNDSFLEMLLQCPAIKTVASRRLTEITSEVERCIKNKIPLVKHKCLYEELKAEEIVDCSWCSFSAKSLNDIKLEAMDLQKEFYSLDPEGPNSTMEIPAYLFDDEISQEFDNAADV